MRFTARSKAGYIYDQIISRNLIFISEIRNTRNQTTYSALVLKGEEEGEEEGEGNGARKISPVEFSMPDRQIKSLIICF